MKINGDKLFIRNFDYDYLMYYFFIIDFNNTALIFKFLINIKKYYHIQFMNIFISLFLFIYKT